jgi:hypothetical protein
VYVGHKLRSHKMTIAFSVGGSRVVTPGVYSVFKVQDSLLNVVASARNILLIGEATEGVPGNLLDPTTAYFSDYPTMQAFFTSGPMVDAARQLFTVQPSAVFTGSVGRVYAQQTNQATRAEKTISLPSAYGTVVATKFGESGNFVKSQIVASAEVLPAISCQVLPLTVNVEAAVSGVKAAGTAAMTFASVENFASNLATLLSGKATVSGGTLKDVVATGSDLTLAVSGTDAIVSSDTPWNNAPQVGEVAIIPHSSGLKGSSDVNIGVYIIKAVTTGSVTLEKVRQMDNTGTASAAWVAPEAVSVPVTAGTAPFTYATGEIIFLEPVTVTVTEAAKEGAGASLELAASSGSLLGVAVLARMSARSNMLSAGNASFATVSATASADQLTVSLGAGAVWASIPKLGDVVHVPANSQVAGGSKQNVGLHIVLSSSPSTVVLKRLDGGSAAAVSSAAVAGNEAVLQAVPAVISSSVAAKKTTSSKEAQVSMNTLNTVSGERFPSDKIGGKVVLEISYTGSAAVAKVSIDTNRRMKLVADTDEVTLPTLKYPTLAALAEKISAQSDWAARVVDAGMSSASPAVLDMVEDVAAKSLTSEHVYAARIKNDWSAWSSFFAATVSIVDFVAGARATKAGLPAGESSQTFLANGAKGATSNADIQAALDAGLKIPTVQVLPLFSRDAYLDVADGLTEPESTYSIDSVHAALKAHVATGWSTAIRRERFGLASFFGSFEESKAKAQTLNYENVSMTFQLARATGSDGNAQWFLPWMLQCCMAAGRSQAILGTPLLRKSFNVLDVKHIPESSIYSDTLVREFDPASKAMLDEAIEAGLLTMGVVEGAGLRLVSPDLSTRSRVNDPKAWVYERNNVSFIFIEVIQTLRSVLENYIGERTTDVTTSEVASTVVNILASFVASGAIVSYNRSPLVTNLGNGYAVQVQVRPAEALEFISLDVTATRNL